MVTKRNICSPEESVFGPENGERESRSNSVAFLGYQCHAKCIFTFVNGVEIFPEIHFLLSGRGEDVVSGLTEKFVIAE